MMAPLVQLLTMLDSKMVHVVILDGTCDKCQPIIAHIERLKVSSAQRLNALHLNFIDLT